MLIKMIMLIKCRECLKGIYQRHQEDLEFQRKELIKKFEKMIMPLKTLVCNSIADEGKKWAYSDMKNVRDEINDIIKQLRELK